MNSEEDDICKRPAPNHGLLNSDRTNFNKYVALSHGVLNKIMGYKSDGFHTYDDVVDFIKSNEYADFPMEDEKAEEVFTSVFQKYEIPYDEIQVSSMENGKKIKKFVFYRMWAANLDKVIKTFKWILDDDEGRLNIKAPYIYTHRCLAQYA